MTQDNPLILAVVTIGFAALFVMWLSDLRAAARGRPNSGAFPGAAPTTRGAVLIGVAGMLVLLALEVGGEYSLGLVGQQSRIGWMFAGYTIVAGFGEELVFRGYLVVTTRGRAALIGSAVGFSALFALAHPYLWEWEDGLELHMTTKAWFSTGMLFAGSLWFYYLRFQGRNPGWSLIPCIVAHVGKNAAVIAIKAAQGFLGPG